MLHCLQLEPVLVHPLGLREHQLREHQLREHQLREHQLRERHLQLELDRPLEDALSESALGNRQADALRHHRHLAHSEPDPEKK